MRGMEAKLGMKVQIEHFFHPQNREIGTITELWGMPDGMRARVKLDVHAQVITIPVHNLLEIKEA